ncbi:hypothetical protein NX059_004911 [Plenodomus lindquistii]|nr:hypothetical protein NX059_004911 [Plenodomus lindquistii]
MRNVIGLLGFVGLGIALPTISTPKTLAPDAVFSSALTAAGDTIVCQGTLDSGPCETIHAQGTCVTLGNNALHKVRNIYQAKGSICKYFDNDCSALEPVVSINSHKQNLWLDLDAEVGDRIGLVLCRNDWPMALQSEEGLDKRGLPLCQWDVNKGEYDCDGQMVDVQVDRAARVVVKGFPSCHLDIVKGEYVCEGQAPAPPYPSLAARQFTSCHIDLEKGEYVCDGEAPAPPSPSITARQFPDCQLDIEKGEYICEGQAPAPPYPSCTFDVTKGEYICDGQALTPRDSRITARQSPPSGCKFDARKGEYICDKATSATLPAGVRLITSTPIASTANNTDLANDEPSKIKVCNEQNGGHACVSFSARANCVDFPETFAHAALTINQEKGLLCFYHGSCKSEALYKATSQDSEIGLSGPGVLALGAVWCALS